MGLIVRVIGLSLFTAALGAQLAFILFGKYSDWPGAALFLGCVGGIIGAIAAATREIVSAQRRPPPS